MRRRTNIRALLPALVCIAAAGVIFGFAVRMPAKADSVMIRALLLKENSARQADVQVELRPGESCSRIVAADNVGAASAWVRVRVDLRITDRDQNTRQCLLGAFGAAEGLDAIRASFLNTEDWSYTDGYWYYRKALAPGETTRPLFTGLRFEGDYANEHEQRSITIQLDMQAQSGRNGDGALRADGWRAKQ